MECHRKIEIYSLFYEHHFHNNFIYKLLFYKMSKLLLDVLSLRQWSEVYSKQTNKMGVIGQGKLHTRKNMQHGNKVN